MCSGDLVCFGHPGLTAGAAHRELNVCGCRGPRKAGGSWLGDGGRGPECRGPEMRTGGRCFLRAGRSPDVPRLGLCSEPGRSPPRRAPLLFFDGLSQK